MKKKTTNRERLTIALLGAGGSLIISSFLSYLLYPSRWEEIWVKNLSFIIIGIFLVLLAVFINLRNRK